jgi:hypothetical protein
VKCAVRAEVDKLFSLNYIHGHASDVFGRTILHFTAGSTLRASRFSLSYFAENFGAVGGTRKVS